MLSVVLLNFKDCSFLFEDDLYYIILFRNAPTRELLLFFVCVNTYKMFLQHILDVATYATNVPTCESQHVAYIATDDSPVATFVSYVATSSISCSNI